MAGGTAVEAAQRERPLQLLTGLLGGLRAAQDPHAELLALVWGPRFDREHAGELLRRVPPSGAPAALQAVLAAADQFDRLPGSHQQRLRRLILRHRGRWENLPHAPHPAD